MRSGHRRIEAFVCAWLLLLGACGSEAGPAAKIEAAATTFESAKIVAESAPPPATVPTSATVTNDQDLPMTERIPIVPFDGPSQDNRSPFFGSQSATGGVPVPVGDFAPTAQDAEFCAAVSVINNRPQPSGDDFLQIVIAAQYFEAIDPFVPAELDESFAAVREWTNGVVEKGSFDESAEAGVELIAPAIEEINAFVDARCLGMI